jgi:hypothetical protein
MKTNESENIGGGTAGNSVVRENVISLEDRERLDNLLERIGDKNIEYGFTENERCQKEELQREGIMGARYLLEKISEISDIHEWSLYYNIRNLSICATPEAASRIGELLIEDKLTQNHDGSNIMNLVHLLGEIGTAEEAHFLSEVVRKTATARGGYLIDCDTHQAFSALRKIFERTKDTAVVREAMDDINAFRKEHRLDELTKEPSYSFVNHSQEYRYDAYNAVEDENEDEDDFEFDDNESQERQESDPFSDNETDERFNGEFYEKHRMLSAVERLEIVKRLRILAQKEKDPDADPEESDDFLRRHFLEYKEKNPSPHSVTLGIEIEIPEKTVLPKNLVKNYSYDDEVYAERNKYYKKFREAEKIGVPNGGDLFWEFAHQPARNPLTISREVQALVGMGLINKKYAKYPLHVTLGGITSFGDEGTGAFLLSHALEATAWSTNADRLTRPYRTQRGSWTQRGGSGVRQRDGSFDEMKRSSEQNIGNTGVEFRTLQLQSLSGLDRHLHSVYYLGTALRAFQERKQKGDNNTIREELADIWTEFSRKCSELFIEIGLVELPQKWRINCDYSNEQSSFKDLAKILEEGTTNKESKSAKFIHGMRLLIIQTRTKVKEILEKEQPTSKE